MDLIKNNTNTIFLKIWDQIMHSEIEDIIKDTLFDEIYNKICDKVDMEKCNEISLGIN